MKNKKFWNVIFILCFFLISIIIVCLNYFIDPYEYKIENRKKYRNISIYSIRNDMIYTYINKTKNIKIDSLVVGSSPVMSLFDVDLFSCYTGKTIASLAYPNMTPFETYELLKYFISVHPEVNNAYISIDVTTYLTNCGEGTVLSSKPTNFFQDFINSYYSIDTLKFSLKKLWNSLQRQERIKNVGYPINMKKKYTYSALNCEYEKCIDINTRQLRKIKTLLDANNIKVTYFFTPLHSLYLSDMYKNDKLELIENLKRSIVKVTSFYDFAFINRHTVEPFEYFWADVTHALPFINSKVYDILVNEQMNTDLAIIVDLENVEELLLKQRSLIQNYIMNNIEYVDEYVNLTLNEAEVVASTEIRKAPKVPEDCNGISKCFK